MIRKELDTFVRNSGFAFDAHAAVLDVDGKQGRVLVAVAPSSAVDSVEAWLIRHGPSAIFWRVVGVDVPEQEPRS